MPFSSSDTTQKISQQVEDYCKVQKYYEKFADFLSATLSISLHNMGILANVSSRAKGRPNFAEKLIRKQDEYPDAVNQFTDLCGARVIVNFANEIEPVCNFIQRYFDIDGTNSEDAVKRLGVSRFGYRSIHYIVSLNNEKVEKLFIDMNLGAKGANLKKPSSILYQHRTSNECKAKKISPGPKFKAEIQVRTLPAACLGGICP